MRDALRGLPCALRVRYYYYFARYVVPFVPVVLVAAAVCLNRLRVRWQALVAALTLVAMVPFAPALVRGTDMTDMDFQTLDEVRAEIDGATDDTVMVVQDGDYVGHSASHFPGHGAEPRPSASRRSRRPRSRGFR